MFPFRNNFLTTTDIGAAAYLMYKGATLEHVECNGRIFCYTISGRMVKKNYNDWLKGKPIKIAPRSFLKMREDLKNFRRAQIDHDTEDTGVRDNLQFADKLNKDGTSSPYN